MIIIPTHISRKDTWLKDCLESLDTKHKVMVLFQGEKPPKDLKIGFDYTFHSLNGYDPGAIVWARENCTDDEFLVLHDSCVIKDNIIFDILFKGYSGNSVAFSNHPTLMGMFLGKYQTELVKQLEPPIANSKEHGVELEETWNREYCQLDYPVLLTEPLNTSDIRETKHGRENMVLENRWIKKYKGTWNRSML